MMKKKKRKPSRGSIVKKLDTIFSQYIRLKYTNVHGIVQCYTCGDFGHRKKMQNGHFISRSNYKYRRDETNCRPQCYKCNCIFSGNYKVYTSRFIDEYTKEMVDKMINDKQITKISTQEILEKIEYYKLRVIELEKNLLQLETKCI